MSGTRLRVGVVGTYPPSRGGQAAFTRELTGALAEYLDLVVCAVDRHRYTYPDEVMAVIAESDVGDFRRAADILAEQAADAVLVLDQGWPGTHHLLDELRRDGIPCLVALPAVRADAPPDRAHPDAYRALAALSAGAERLLVRTLAAARVIEAAAGTQLRVVPAGVPTAGPLSLIRPAVQQALAPTGLPAGRIISTVAPIRPGRGIEVAISGLPGLVAAHPDLRYVIAGPVGVRAEAYRDFLRDLVVELDLGGHVAFLDADLTLAESAFVLNRSLVHVVPRLDPERTCSATIARGVAAGCATVAGLHPYSAELLATGAGQLVRPGDPGALAAAIGGLLADPDGLAVARRVARGVGTGFGAPAVAQRIGELVREVARPRLERVVAPPLRLPTGPALSGPGSSVAVPSALAVVGAGLLAVPMESLPEAGWSTAVGWVGAAVPRLTTLAEPTGRALWALSHVAASAGVPEAVRLRAAVARQGYAGLLPDDLTDTAFAVLGLAIDPDPAARLALRCAAGRLNAAWRAEERGWPWFTDRVLAEGARLPQALIAAAVRLSDDGMLARGQEALEWYGRRIGLGAGGPRGTVAGADPAVETGAVIEAYAEAFRATGSVHYGRIAARGLSWLPATDSLAYLGAVLALRAVGLVELSAPVPVPLLAPAA